MLYFYKNLSLYKSQKWAFYNMTLLDKNRLNNKYIFKFNRL